MQLGIMAAGIVHLGWDKALEFCRHLGLGAIEIPCGAYARKHLFNPDQVLQDDSLARKIKEDLSRAELALSALGCHGNPVHPDPELARMHEQAHDRTIRLAKKLGVDTILNFSGCPGGAPGDKTPNWITCVWPTEYASMLEYQWNDVLIPFWQRKAREAANEGIKIALEPHPGFSVYNPETLLRLRQACGQNLGVNLDPSHFFWQGIDPVEAARNLGEAGAIFHLHAKDTAIDRRNTAINGVLDTKSYGDLKGRSWVFRTCGYGHGDEFWKPFISMLRCQGYDGVLSVEHEDSYMSGPEGLKKAVEYLKGVLIWEKADQAWWF